VHVALFVVPFLHQFASPANGTPTNTQSERSCGIIVVNVAVNVAVIAVAFLVGRSAARPRNADATLRIRSGIQHKKHQCTKLFFVQGTDIITIVFRVRNHRFELLQGFCDDMYRGCSSIHLEDDIMFF